MSWPCGAYNRVLNCGSTRPKEEVFKVFEPKRVDSQGTATWSQMSFVPQQINWNYLDEMSVNDACDKLTEKRH